MIYRKEINGLRALAVIPVVLFHAGFDFFSGGFAGVDVFFVISGYLITTIIFEKLDKGIFSFSNFYARRIKRIFPALILVLIASFVFGWFTLFPDEYQQLGKHIAGASGFTSNFILWWEDGYFDNASETKPLLHLWSLAIEEQFYIVWPLFVWISYKFRLHIPLIIIILIIISFYLNIYQVEHNKIAAFYSPQTRFWELLTGSLAAWFLMYKKSLLNTSQKIGNIFSLVGVTLISFSYIYLDKNMLFPGFWAVIPVIGAVLIILSNSQNWTNRVILSNRIFTWFGLISYSLYLWHWPLLSFANIMEGSTADLSIRILAIITATFFAWGTFKLIEQPIRLGRANNFKILTPVLILLFVGFLGYNSYSRNGYEFRQIGAYFEKLKIDQTDAECFEYTNNIQSDTFRYCRYNNVDSSDSSESIAVIGDSHAAAAYPGIAELAEDVGKSAILMGGGSLNNGKWKISNEILNSVILNNDIKTVFFSTRGVYHVNGTEPYSLRKKANNTDKLQELILYNIFFQNTQDAIDQITNSGKKVYYIMENPELSKNPKSCLKRIGFLKLNANDCRPLRRDVLRRQNEYMKRVKGLSNVHIVKVTDVFCPEIHCLVLKDGHLLYSDDDHLSVYGSKFQAKELLKLYVK